MSKRFPIFEPGSRRRDAAHRWHCPGCGLWWTELSGARGSGLCPECGSILRRPGENPYATGSALAAWWDLRQAWRNLRRSVFGPLSRDIVPCRVCGSVEPGHDQCGEGMQMEYRY